MLLNQKYEIFPSPEQIEILETWLSYCRLTYNSALLDKQRKYRQSKESYSRFDMQKQLKQDKQEWEFLKEIPSQALQEVFRRLDHAFTKFFRKEANYPKLKKYKDYNSMTFPQFGFKPNTHHRYAASFTENGKLQLSKLGQIPIHLHRPMEGTIKQLIIKRQGSRWYAIFSVEGQAYPAPINRDLAVGIDVGINKYAVLSDGKSYENPTFIRKTEKKLKRAQAKLSKMKRGSANYAKQVSKVHLFYEKVANQRRDFLHKLSYHLAKDYSIIAVEDLDIRHMVKNKRLSKSISDAGWGMFRNMLSYKCERNGSILLKVDPAFTSQDCSTCGTRVKKSLSIRTHICKGCGTILDRDHNASLHILRKGMEQLDQMVVID
ncbi:RNA-guided endonuclease InsQ/TnpB family protein [Virgibacillus dakarensis]|uniref:RNA-guided endonuclease InsQ/TnpB family protein n=1 Tax=Virgibacillus dakarensis TaxID=1917889 RepID=UPI000B438B20|nr:RNA-guided endonuclease TnpB family protein [Virgibacillus dakarensis]